MPPYVVSSPLTLSSPECRRGVCGSAAAPALPPSLSAQEGRGVQLRPRGGPSPWLNTNQQSPAARVPKYNCV